jgi:hypothetical protein
VLLIAIAAAVATALLIAREIQVRRSVYAKILEDRTVATGRELTEFLRPVRNGLSVIRQWGKNGSKVVRSLLSAGGQGIRNTPTACGQLAELRAQESRKPDSRFPAPLLLLPSGHAHTQPTRRRQTS